MAEKPAGGGSGGGGWKPSGGGKPKGGGGGASGGFPGILFFVLLIGAIGYAFYLQLPGVASQNGSSANSGNDIFRRIFPGLYSTSTQETMREIPTDLPPGFGADDLSPFFREARITGFAGDSDDGKVLLIRIPRGAAIVGWTVRGALGSQLIGAEGGSGGGDVRIPLRDGVLFGEHDQMLLFDGQGKLADYFSF